MNELKTMGNALMEIALQYTHPSFEYMYPDWGAVCNIGEELVRLSDKPPLNENQQVVLEHLKGMFPAKLGVSAMVTVYCLVDDNINDNWQEYSDEIPEHIEALQELSVAEENQVLEVFANWVLEQDGRMSQ